MIFSKLLTDRWTLAPTPQNGPLSSHLIRDLTSGRFPAPKAAPAKAPVPEKWLDCPTMPAQVHDVLLEHNVIRHPFKIGAAAECLWVEQYDWVYRCEFSLDPQSGFDPASDSQRVFLHFGGLDTVVDLYLNGNKIASNKDGFIPLRVDISGHLLPEGENNVLLLHFYAIEPWSKKDPQIQEIERQGGAVKKAIRKSVEDFGFFNGAKPRFMASGVFGEVSLQVVDTAEIRHVEIRQDVAPDLGSAQLILSCELDKYADADLTPHWEVLAPDGQNVFSGSEDAPSLTIDNPSLWYPHTHGDQPLYTINLTLKQGDRALHQVTRRVGLRRVEQQGEFDFRVNNARVKLWGANLTPLPVPSHVHDPAKLSVTLDRVVQANMPVIRVWGPSQPWPEDLVDQADARGIMLWMEFGHTGPGYPGADWFQEMCRNEARHWVQSWKHHACILFWSGGNEAYLGLEADEPEEMSPDRQLFDHVYREVVEELDPGRWYIPNSPYGGPYGNYTREGDSHIRNYQFFQPGDDFPVLPSENIRITIALKKTLKRHLGPHLRWPVTGFTGHRTHFNDPIIPPSWLCLTPDQFWVNVRAGLMGDLYESDGSVDGLLFRMGAGTSLWIRKTIERFRRGRPHWDPHGPRQCMGHQWWKLNDTFPMIYAGLIDDQLEPNMSYYALRRAYQPLLLTAEVGSDLIFWIVNDTAADVEGTLRVDLLNNHGTEVLNTLNIPVRVPQGESQPVGNSEPFGMFERSHPLHLQFVPAAEEGGEPDPIGSTLLYTAPEREMWYPEDARITLEQIDAQTLRVSADKIARWVELQGDNPQAAADGGPADAGQFGWYFEDNFFDLIPGHPKIIHILGEHRAGTVTAKSRYSPHQAQIELQNGT